MAESLQEQTESPADVGGPSFRRNYRLGLVNGALGRLGNSLLNPHLVLSAFVYSQLGSNMAVGLLIALSMAGHRLPQLYISSLIEHRTRKKLFYVGASVLRSVALLTMLAAMLLSAGEGRRWILVLMFGAYFVFRLAQGCASVPFMDILAGAIGPSRVGGFFAVRHFLGSWLVLLCGFLVVQPVQSAVREPYNYALLTGIAIVILSVSWASFSMFHEVSNAAPPKRRNVRQSFAACARMLREQSNYRWLLCLRVLAQVNGLMVAFYIPYGVEKLGAVGISGVFLSLMSASRLVSSLIWGRISDRKGNRICLALAGLFFAVSPVAALAAPGLPGAFRCGLPFSSVQLDLPLLVYLLALTCFGLGQQANMIGSHGFMLESAPPARRPSYIAFLNTVTFPMTFLPALAGLLVDREVVGLSALFAIVAASGILTFLVGLSLTEVRNAARDGTGALIDPRV